MVDKLKCEKYRARMVLSTFEGNLNNAMDYLFSTIASCNGDQE
jgi:hypothetical protein